MANETIGSRLSAMRKRTGISLAEIARLAGYSGASSVQVYFSLDYDPPGLDLGVARKLARALVGRGAPPIRENEVLALAGVQVVRSDGGMQETVVTDGKALASEPPRSYTFDRAEVTEPAAAPPSLKGQPKDVPVFGTALAADLYFDTEKNEHQPVEQTTVDIGDVVAYVRRPPGLDADRSVYVVFVVGHSMEPRYRPGDPVFVDPHRPPSIGDDVIVQIAEDDGNDGQRVACGLIKTLTRRTASAIELEQYQPALRFRVDTARVASVHRIIPWREAFGI